MFDWLVSTAWAMAPGGSGGAGGEGGSGWMQILPLVLMFAIFYFLLIRPQQKKTKAHREMVANVRKGDTVLTTGGIYGKVTGVTESTLVVEIAPQVRVKINRSNVSAVGGPASENPPAKK